MRQRAWKKWPYFYLLMRGVLRHAAAIHVTSASERRGLAALGFKRTVRTIGIGVPLPEHVERKARVPLRILFLGRIDPKKAIETLLEAYGNLLSRGHEDLRLDIAGDGEISYRHQLEVRACALGPSVQFLGFVRGEQKARLFAESDLFAMPSYHENFGIAAVEALSWGLPGVVSDGVALAEEIQQAGAGERVPVGDATALSMAIERLAEPARLSDASLRARELVERSFSLEVMGVALERLYEDVSG
jgi:glycosyltransferase involved in cell wall biosynthesis